jgi:signal transduction histidine kinase
VVGNAIKYSPRGSTVTVTLRADATHFELTIADEGPGFDATELETLLLPGRVGRARPTGGESQTGLGLWIAHQAMRSMGGELRIEAGSPGARVGLRLPRRLSEVGA